MDINRQNLADLFVGFKNAFNQGFNGVEAEWNKVATEVPSTTAENHYAWLGQFPALKKWIGDRRLQQMASHDYRIKNEKFESSVPVPRDAIDDDQFGVYRPLMEQMGNAAATHPDELVFGLIALGFTAPCYDGQPFFDSDHPVGRNNVTSVSNYQDGTGPGWFLLDTRRPLKPLIFQKRREYDFRTLTNLDSEHVFMRDEYVYGVDARVNVGFGFWQQAFGSKAELTGDNFNSAIAAVQSFRSDEGRPLGTNPSLLVCGPSNRAAALEVVKAERNAAGATNINRNAVDVLVSPWLA